MNAKSKGKTSAVTKIFFAIVVVAAVIAAATIGGILWYLHSGDDVDYSKLRTAAKPLNLYAANGEIADYCTENYGYIEIEELPDDLKNAFIAVEDKRFYSHDGIDYIRLAGAAIANLRSGSYAEGGSTITQQLAKNIYLTSEKSFSRKLREAQIAVKLEEHYSKDEILEYYLNMLYFGCGEYGVKNAAKRFFGKEPSELELEECAMLAATVKAPSKLNPIADPDACKERAALVLDLMAEQGLIDENRRKSANFDDIIIKDDLIENSLDKIYVANALAEASSILGIDEEEIAAKGYCVYTYLDYDALDALADAVQGSDTDGMSAAIAADVATHSVSAVYADFALDLKSFSRQSGSTLKPLVAYAPAFESGILCPSSVLDDSKRTFGDYTPSNFNDVYYGSVSAKSALSLSLNVPAVQVLSDVGVSEGYNTLQKLGIRLGDEDDNLSLALGATQIGIALSDLLGGYVALADGGNFASLALVSCITDEYGDVVYRRNTDVSRVFSPETSYLVTDCLLDCATNGTAKKLSPLGLQIAAKTGTVGDDSGNHDAYCVAYSSDVAALFWCGSADYNSVIDVQGGGAPTIRAREFFDALSDSRDLGTFSRPDGIVEARLDKSDLSHGALTLAGDSAPDHACEKALFNARYLPESVNYSFDVPSAKDLSIRKDNGLVEISFCADPRLCYRIVRRNFFNGETVLSQLSEREGVVTVTDAADGIFPTTYAVIPWYADDSGAEVLGRIETLRA